MVLLGEEEVLDLGAIALSPAGVQFEMLGGVSDKLWPPSQNAYTKTGILRNPTGNAGNTYVTAWYKIGNYGEIHDVYKQSISLGPGETQELSYNLTRADIEQAELEYWMAKGYEYIVNYEFVLAYLSIGDHTVVSEGDFAQYTLDRIYFQ